MFRKTLAAATTALVAAIFTFGAVAAPASADDGSDPAAPTSTVTTDAGAAGTDTPANTTPSDSTPPAPEAPPAAPETQPAAPETPPESTPAPDADPSTIVQSTATTAAAPEKQCLPNSAVSYTYKGLQKINEGTITIVNPDPTVYTDDLCQGFYVTAAGWRFLNTNETDNYKWPQGIIGYQEANNGDPIVHKGTYDFGFPVTCGQGDIYASYSPIEKPNGILTYASTPYQEHFLQGMFTGPWPTSMWTTSSDSVGQFCDVLDSKVVAPEIKTTETCGVSKISWKDETGKITYALTSGNGFSGVNVVTATTHGDWVFSDNTTTAVYTFNLGKNAQCDVTPGDPTVSPAVCTDGSQGNGTIFVDQQTGILDYTITYPDGHTVTVTTPSLSVPAGVYTVNVTTAPGYQLAGPNSWPLSVTVGPATDCGQLPTDAVLPTSVTSVGATCSTGTGSITVGPSSDYLEFIDYFIDGKKVNQPTTAVSAGMHIVTAAVNQATAPGDTLDNGGPWTIRIGAASTVCGQLKTLALTGTTPTVPLMAAGILLPAGAALLLGAALIRRRREQ